MAEPSYDLDELSARLNAHLARVSQSFRPDFVFVQVEDDSTRRTNGWVIGRLENRQVQVIVPGNISGRVGDTLICFPPNGPTDNYWAFGAWSSDGGSFVPQAQGRIGVSIDNVSSPPTEAEITAAFGSPSAAGAGAMAVIDDAGIDTAVWLCVSTGTSWWYVALTESA